jgi:rRNA processing protein Krr1/Pno1
MDRSVMGLELLSAEEWAQEMAAQDSVKAMVAQDLVRAMALGCHFHQAP